MGKTTISVTDAARNFESEKTCSGRDLAAAMAKTTLTGNEAADWRRDLQTAWKTLKTPADKWR